MVLTAEVGKPVLILRRAPLLERRDKTRQRHVMGVAKGKITTIGAAVDILGMLLHLKERHFDLCQFRHFTGKGWRWGHKIGSPLWW